MAKVMTKQSDLDRIFKKMERDYGAFNKKQQAYAIREIGRVRGEVSDLLADFSDSEGVIKRNRASRILRELDVVEESIREHGTVAMDKVIGDTSEWTSKRINGKGGLGISGGTFDRVNENAIKYVIERYGDDGLVLSDRIWGLSGEIRDEISTVIRSGIIKGDGVSAMIPKIRKAYDNETWKIRRLARNESTTAYRAAINFNAKESDIVEWVQFHHGDKRTDACVSLANEDRYGKGRGVFKPTDTDILHPHVNCTGYSTYILDERWL